MEWQTTWENPFDAYLWHFQDLIGDQEHFRQYGSTVGRFIQGGLQNTMGFVVPGDAGHLSQDARQGIDFFSLDGITFERHGRGADLLFSKRFGDFTNRGRLQKPQVECKLIK